MERKAFIYLARLRAGCIVDWETGKISPPPEAPKALPSGPVAAPRRPRWTR